MWMCGFDLVDQEVLSHSMVHQSLFCTYFECLASRRGSDFNRTHAARVLVLVHALPEAVYGCTFDLTLLRVLEDYSTPVLGWSHERLGSTFYHSHTVQYHPTHTGHREPPFVVGALSA